MCFKDYCKLSLILGAHKLYGKVQRVQKADVSYKVQVTELTDIIFYQLCKTQGIATHYYQSC